MRNSALTGRKLHMYMYIFLALLCSAREGEREKERCLQLTRLRRYLNEYLQQHTVCYLSLRTD